MLAAPADPRADVDLKVLIGLRLQEVNEIAGLDVAQFIGRGSLQVKSAMHKALARDDARNIRLNDGSAGSGDAMTAKIDPKKGVSPS